MLQAVLVHNVKDISIHALCEEGDQTSSKTTFWRANFYPRPLRGGRRTMLFILSAGQKISIHALCEEGDAVRGKSRPASPISIHALCEEGDCPRPQQSWR